MEVWGEQRAPPGICSSGDTHLYIHAPLASSWAPAIATARGLRQLYLVGTGQDGGPLHFLGAVVAVAAALDACGLRGLPAVVGPSAPALQAPQPPSEPRQPGAVGAAPALLSWLGSRPSSQPRQR